MSQMERMFYELAGIAQNKRQPQQEPMTTCATESRFGRAMPIAFDVDYIIRNNRRKHAYIVDREFDKTNKIVQWKTYLNFNSCLLLICFLLTYSNFYMLQNWHIMLTFSC